MEKDLTDYQKPKYPAFIDLIQKRCLVIGGGSVAERKIETLLSYGARVCVIAPDVTETIQEWSETGLIELVKRPYVTGDIQDAFLVISATNDPNANEAVFYEACSHSCLVNVVDEPKLCTFYVPSIVRRGPLQIAISTSGAAPTVAKRIRKAIEERYGHEWSTYLELLGDIRGLVLSGVSGGEAERKPIFEALDESDIFERISNGESIGYEQAYEEYVLPLIANRERNDLA